MTCAGDPGSPHGRTRGPGAAGVEASDVAEAAPGWLDELAFGATGPPWLAMGLSRLDQAGWLLPDAERATELAERHRLLADRHDAVFAALPNTEAAGAETLVLVRAWFARHRPDIVLSADPPGIHPLEAAGRLVQEDLCLMVRADDGHHLDAACLCFPSHWRLAEKLGRTAAVLHEPVPRYDAELASRVDRYLDRLRPDTVAQRRNWSVHESPDLFAPWPLDTAPLLDAGGVATALWLRSERQTLRRLPETGAVLFTIRVQQVPFGALAARPDIARRLASRISAQPAELTAMNGLAAHRGAVLDWLEQMSVSARHP